MIFAGVDIGAISTEVVLLNSRYEVIEYLITDTGSNHKTKFENSLSTILAKAKVTKEQIRYMVGTGYGRYNIPLANKQITEISCHPKGAHFLFPETRTVIDVGGQDSKVMSLDDRGNVSEFFMNDKCAAGTGRFLEVMAGALEIDLHQLNHLSKNSTKTVDISSICAVFAESEVISKIAEGHKKEDIIKGIHNAISEKIAGMVKRIGVANEVTFTGGVANNQGIVQALEEKLGVKINVPEEPQIVGALGAAIFALEAGNEG